MGRYRKLYTAVSMTAMILSLAVVASAQWRNGRGNNGGYYGNSSYNRNLDNTIRNLRDKARRFEDVLDRELDRSRYDGTRREDQLNDLAERFKNAAEDLDDEYEGYNRGSFNSSRDEAQRVISYGSQLDRALSSSRSNRNSSLRGSWNSIERDIRTIARAYNLRYNSNSRYNRNNRNNRNDRYNRNRNRNDRYNQNRNRNRRGTYNGRYNGNLRGTIVSLRNQSRVFEDRIDREYNGRYNRNRNRRYGYSDNLEQLSDRFNDAVKRLEREYDDRRDYNDTYDEANRVLRLGEQLDRAVSRSGVSRSIRNDWSRIERNLRTLARAYNQRYSGNGSIRDIFRNWPF